MALSKTLQQFLDRMQVEYEVFLHAPTPSASRTAEASHISADKIAKGVLLKDESGYVLAVLPASHHLDLQEIERVLDSPASLAGELELAEIFRDCELGAVPAVGAAYGLDVIADERVMALGEVYFEGGDHTSLVRVGAADFRKLMGDVQQARLARHD